MTIREAAPIERPAVERVWLYLREHCLSLRVFRDDRALVDACRQA